MGEGERKGGRERKGEGEREGWSLMEGRAREGGEGLYRPTVAAAACSAQQQPVPRLRHAAPSLSRTMSFRPCRPGPRAR